MKHTLVIVSFLAVAGCEVFTVGSKRPPVQEINQRSAVGAVYLFKSELDSNNAPAATEVLARPNGRQLLAIEKYELYDEMNRLGRLIAHVDEQNLRHGLTVHVHAAGTEDQRRVRLLKPREIEEIGVGSEAKIDVVVAIALWIGKAHGLRPRPERLLDRLASQA